MADETTAAPGLPELRPADGSHRDRKRVGRGVGERSEGAGGRCAQSGRIGSCARPGKGARTTDDRREALVTRAKRRALGRVEKVAE